MDIMTDHCPTCHAPLSVPAGADDVTCEACGTTTSIHDLEPASEARAFQAGARGAPAKRKGGWNTVVGCFGWGVLWMFAVTTLLSGVGSSRTGSILALALATAGVVGLYVWSRRSKAAKTATK